MKFLPLQGFSIKIEHTIARDYNKVVKTSIIKINIKENIDKKHKPIFLLINIKLYYISIYYILPIKLPNYLSNTFLFIKRVTKGAYIIKYGHIIQTRHDVAHPACLVLVS